MPEYLVHEGEWYMTDFCLVRDLLWHVITKVIVVGFFCDDEENGAGLEEHWDIVPETLRPDSPGQVFEFEGPAWTWCGNEVPARDISFEFYDVTPGLLEGNLDWITIDKDSNIIKIVTPTEGFKIYN